MNSSTMGVVTVGTADLSAHLAALKETGYRLVGNVPDGATGSSELWSRQLEEAISKPDVDIVILRTSFAETEYCLGRAASAGKHVVCELPLAKSSHRTGKLARQFKAAGLHMAVFSDLVHSELGTEIRQVAAGNSIGPLLFAEMKVAVKRRAVSTAKDGVLTLHAMGALALLSSYFGRVDTILARTRSLGTNRPQEDIAIVQLRYENGLEALLVVDGLGDKSEIEVTLHGTIGTRRVRSERDRLVETLVSQYEELGALVENGEAMQFTAEEAVEASFCLDWIQQSARHESEVRRTEVARGAS